MKYIFSFCNRISSSGTFFLLLCSESLHIFFLFLFTLFCSAVVVLLFFAARVQMARNRTVTTSPPHFHNPSISTLTSHCTTEKSESFLFYVVVGVPGVRFDNLGAHTKCSNAYSKRLRLLFAFFFILCSALWSALMRSSTSKQPLPPSRAPQSRFNFFLLCSFRSRRKKTRKESPTTRFYHHRKLRRVLMLLLDKKGAEKGKLKVESRWICGLDGGGKLWGTTTTSTTLSKHYNSNKRHYLTWHCHFLRSLASPSLSLSRPSEEEGKIEMEIPRPAYFIMKTFSLKLFLCSFSSSVDIVVGPPHPFLASITFHYFLAHSQTLCSGSQWRCASSSSLWRSISSFEPLSHVHRATHRRRRRHIKPSKGRTMTVVKMKINFHH